MHNLSRMVRFWVKSIILGKNVAFVALIILWYGAIADFGADASYGDFVLTEAILTGSEIIIRRKLNFFAFY